jgi:hypothetical protein
MKRAFYFETISRFLHQENESILGLLVTNNPYELTDLQRNSWIHQIELLKDALHPQPNGYVIFEYAIPRMGKRVDVIVIQKGIVFVIEFKIGMNRYERHAIDQVVDYALDLKNFHKESHDKFLVPIVVASQAGLIAQDISELKEGILSPILCNDNNLGNIIAAISRHLEQTHFNPLEWLHGNYQPTPTIIEAAQALYQGHEVADISRNDASAFNLSRTSQAINRIIDRCKANHEKAICFITGVPGSGKTLAGLNIANERHNFHDEDHAVFLSGNQPLVEVLREALARDDHQRTGIKKNEALSRTRAFIQNIYHFRDDTLAHEQAPLEKIVIFDEAQRAWTKEKLSDFMSRKKGLPDFNVSEPEFLISVMDRHQDWAVIICLIGGGQEIHDGEAGLSEWFAALKRQFLDWQVYLSDKLSDSEFLQDSSLDDLVDELKSTFKQELHLSVSLRSFRSENVSAFVKALLDADLLGARTYLKAIGDQYPIALTRNLETAKSWVRKHAKGTERFGLIASSGASRLRPHGIWVHGKISSASNWFLNDRDDIRSSFALEETATEFDIQGLELDWSIIGWDADLRFQDNDFGYFNFRGTRWNNVHSQDRKLYLKNSYRVLLTRARQGMIIFIPEGDDDDLTRKREYYDGTYHYLKSIGVEEV